MARIAVGGMQHETNTFAPSKADYAAFEDGGGWPGVQVGEPLFDAVAGANIPVQGAIQAMSRSYYGRLVPPDRASEFFGFYNMMGKFASVLGPFLMGATALITGNSRSAILSVAILFVGGAIMLTVATRSLRVAPAVAQEPA